MHLMHTLAAPHPNRATYAPILLSRIHWPAHRPGHAPDTDSLTLAPARNIAKTWSEQYFPLQCTGGQFDDVSDSNIAL